MKYVETLEFLDRRVSVGTPYQAAPAKIGYARAIKKIEGPPEEWLVEVLFPSGETVLIGKVGSITVLK